MRLTSFTDFALRLLLYAAARSDRLITIEEAARVYGISKAHLMKITNALTRAGFLRAVRGRSGGLALALRPADIRIGDVVRATEPDFVMAECFTDPTRCVISPICKVRTVFDEAVGSFNAALDRYTLEDVLIDPGHFGLPAAS